MLPMYTAKCLFFTPLIFHKNVCCQVRMHRDLYRMKVNRSEMYKTLHAT